ncbi:vacuolar membrane protein [Salix suchowensis]|nr:vacuolar membrane protein [Salix suchowensis]
MVSIRAHDSKIYGIDWSHSIRNEIVTCSLDHTIKVWDVNASPAITSSFRDLHSPSLGSSLQSFTLYPSDVEVGVISSTASSNGINGTGNSRQTPMAPKTTIRTVYPVWRARNLPFAQGVLSLAQRGETALEMYRTDSSFPGAGSKEKTPTNIHTTSHVPVEVFEGHKDVVKEFVWRKGGQEATEYQLITWSKDRTLRFWPMDQETMQVNHSFLITLCLSYPADFYASESGHIYSPPRGRARYPTVNDQNISFRNPPEGTEYHPALSAPIGHRSILAEVRAAPPRMRRGDLGHYNIHTSTQSINPVLQPHVGSAHRASLHEHFAAAKGSNGNTALLSTPDVGDYVSASTNGNLETTGSGSGPIGMPPGTIRRSGTMSKGGLGGRSVARMDALSWLQNVRVGPGSQQHRSSSSGPGSSSTRSSTGQESNPPSRLGSRSRPGSGSDPRNTLSRQTSDTYDDNEHGGS